MSTGGRKNSKTHDLINYASRIRPVLCQVSPTMAHGLTHLQLSSVVEDTPKSLYAVWYCAIAITARVSVLLGCRSLSKIVK